MPRAPARFTQADMARAIKAMRDAGCNVTGVRVDREGTIEVLCAPPAEVETERRMPSSLADWRKERGHGAR
jgi:hypothetical protein